MEQLETHPVPDYLSSRWWLEKMFASPSVTMPKWMRTIVEQECAEHCKAVPLLSAKYVDRYGYMGGYTVHPSWPSVEGEICIIYGIGKWFGTTNELNTLLHEIAHWLVGYEPDSPDGHTPNFYSKLLELTLKHNADVNTFLQDETNYVGEERVYEGISLFHSTYNV